MSDQRREIEKRDSDSRSDKHSHKHQNVSQMQKVVTVFLKSKRFLSSIASKGMVKVRYTEARRCK